MDSGFVYDPPHVATVEQAEDFIATVEQAEDFIARALLWNEPTPPAAKDNPTPPHVAHILNAGESAWIPDANEPTPPPVQPSYVKMHCPVCKQDSIVTGTKEYPVDVNCPWSACEGTLICPPVQRTPRGYLRISVNFTRDISVNFTRDISVAAILTPLLISPPCGLIGGWWMSEGFSIQIAAASCGVMYCLLALRVVTKGEDDECEK